MTKGKEEWQKSFQNLELFLTSFAEQGRLGWERHSAKLELNLDPSHLEHLQPDQIFGASFEPHLEGILERLADNAADHAFREGKELTISITSKREDNALFIDISDNGPGISHLEDKTVGAERIIRHKGSDLSRAVEMAHVLGGDILARNIINGEENIRGAKFTVILPVPERG